MSTQHSLDRVPCRSKSAALWRRMALTCCAVLAAGCGQTANASGDLDATGQTDEILADAAVEVDATGAGDTAQLVDAKADGGPDAVDAIAAELPPDSDVGQEGDANDAAADADAVAPDAAVEVDAAAAGDIADVSAGDTAPDAATDAGNADAATDAGGDAVASGPYGALFGHPCAQNADCGSAMACQRAGCSAIGACVFAPATCAGVTPWAVCGCDGQTYASACEATVADVGVKANWACDAPPTGVALCDVGAVGACGAGHFCSGPCAGVGTCESSNFSIACQDQTWWTLGCDGTLFGNDCGPPMTGVAPVPIGAGSIPCSPATSVSCPSGTTCVSAAGSCGTLPKFDGHCMPLPTTCPPLLEQVCGCDGVTYDNACLALKAGTSAFASGPCTAGFNLCSAKQPSICTGGSYCETFGCDFFTSGGVCAPQPASCPAISAPVCSCSGTTFANECLLQQAGLGKASDGACP